MNTFANPACSGGGDGRCAAPCQGKPLKGIQCEPEERPQARASLKQLAGTSSSVAERKLDSVSALGLREIATLNFSRQLQSEAENIG